MPAAQYALCCQVLECLQSVRPIPAFLPIPRCEPMALHRHPDVQLAMKAVGWHSLPLGKELLAHAIVKCQDAFHDALNDESRTALLTGIHNSSCLMVSDAFGIHTHIHMHFVSRVCILHAGANFCVGSTLYLGGREIPVY